MTIYGHTYKVLVRGKNENNPMRQRWIDQHIDRRRDHGLDHGIGI